MQVRQLRVIYMKIKVEKDLKKFLKNITLITEDLVLVEFLLTLTMIMTWI